MAAPKYFADPSGTVGVTNPETGEVEFRPESEAQSLMREGWAPETYEQVHARELESQRAKDWDNPLGAGAAGLLRGATLGLSDVAYRALDPERAAFELSNLKKYNPGASLAGELAGSVAGMFVPGAPVAAVTKMGAGVGRATQAALGGGALAKIGGATARGIAEGAAFGLGGGVSEIATARELPSPDDAAAILARHMGAGAAFGGGLGLIGSGMVGLVRGATGGVGRASKAMGEMSAARTELGDAPVHRDAPVANQLLGVPA